MFHSCRGCFYVSGPKSELLLSLPFYSADIRKFPEPKLPRYCLGRSLTWGTNIGAEDKRCSLFSLALLYGHCCTWDLSEKRVPPATAGRTEVSK